jgi:hypothetical protein
MDIEQILKRISPWIPLLIAAGYFVFLIATWQQFITNQKKIDDIIAKVLPHDSAGNSDPI